ncbi:MAG: amidohydrolase family protein [Planctomycetota bacterium]
MIARTRNSLPSVVVRPFVIAIALAASLLQSGIAIAVETKGELGRWESSSGGTETVVYLADHLFTGTADDAIEDAALITRDGQIIEVTTQNELKTQPGWKVETLAGATLMPGIVIAETGLLGGAEEERTLSPEIRSIDGFDFFAEYDSLLARGITAVQVSAGRNRLIPGQTAVVKLAGDDPVARTVAEVESLRLQLTQSAFSAPTIYEPPVAAVSVERPLVATRFQVAGDLPSALLTVRALWSAAKENTPADDPEEALIIDSIRPFLGETIRVTARSTNEVVAAVELMDELNQPFVLVAPSRVMPVVDQLAASKQLRGVLLEHDLRPGVLISLPDPESDSARPKSISEKWLTLRKRLPETPIALKPISDADLSDIRFLVAVLARGDVSISEALTSVTGDAAKLLGVDDSIGTLAAGKVADFVVLSGSPLDPQTKVLKTFVDGEMVFSSEPQETSMLLSGATVCMPDGSERLAEVAVSGRSIRAVGGSVSADPLGKNYALDGCYITPGFVDAGTKLGAGRTISNRVSLGDQLGKYLVPDDSSVRRGRIGGVAIGLLSSDLLPSPVVAFKLSDQPRVLKDPVALRSRLSGNPTTAESTLVKTLTGAKAYADSWVAYDKKMAEYKVALAKYEAEKKKYDAEVAKKKKKEEEAKKKAEAEKAKASSSSKSSSAKKPEAKPTEEKKESAEKAKPEAKPAAKTSGDEKKEAEAKKDAEKSPELKAPTKPAEPKAPRKVSTLEPYRAVFKKEIPMIIEVSEEAGVETALSVVVDKFDLQLVLAVSGTAYLSADQIAEKEVPVIVGPTLTTVRDGRTYNLPQYYRTAGCRVLFQTRATTGASSLPLVVAHAASRGLGRGDAVQALTSDAAEIFNLKNVGQVKPGFDADLTVFDGPPFYPSSRVIGVMIDGQWAYLDEAYDSYASSKAGR